MKLRLNPFLRHSLLAAAAIGLGASAAHAVDYNWGDTVSDSFTINATDRARDENGNGTFDQNSGDMGIYWRGSVSDRTFLHFDLSTLQGTTITGNTSLNYTVNATWGGNLTGSTINTANTAWTFSAGGATPAFTAISGATNATGNLSTGQTATWSFGSSVMQGFVDSPSTFYGLVLNGASGTTAHFSGTPTLTGTYTAGEVRVLNGTDWSAASYDNGTNTLSISGSNTVTGGSLSLATGTTLSVVDSATLGSGNFVGNILNNGTISYGSSTDQTLSGAISGTGGLTKSGAGTLKLTAVESYTGATIVNQGILELAGPNSGNSGLYTSSGITINNGGQILVSASNALFGWNAGNVGTVTINAGGLMNQSTGLSVTFRAPLILNGGTLASTGTPLAGYGSWRLYGDVSATGTVASTISAQNVYLDGTKTFTVSDAAGNLSVTGNFIGGALTKSGAGTMTLSGTNSYTGATQVNMGKLVVSGSIGNSSVNVNNAGTVLASGTTGTIGKSVTVNNGAILAAGGQGSRGTATVGSDGLTFTSGSIFEWDLASSASGTRGTQYDAVDVSGGNLSGSGAIFKVVLNSGNFGESFWNTSHDWTGIFTASNAINLSSIFSEIQWNGNSSLTYGTTTAPGYFSFTNSGTTLTWTAVPEPTSTLAGLLLTAGLLRRRR